MADRIWTDEQVVELVDFQKSPNWHPYTCGGGDGPCSGVTMDATPQGLVCPRCQRVQTWAHEWALDGRWREAWGE